MTRRTLTTIAAAVLALSACATAPDAPSRGVDRPSDVPTRSTAMSLERANLLAVRRQEASASECNDLRFCHSLNWTSCKGADAAGTAAVHKANYVANGKGGQGAAGHGLGSCNVAREFSASAVDAIAAATGSGPFAAARAVAMSAGVISHTPSRLV